MDAKLVGVGFVMVSRTGGGKYEYDRVDPARVQIQVPSAADVAAEASVGAVIARAAWRAGRVDRLREKLALLVKRGEVREGEMRGWIPTEAVKSVLATDAEDGVAPGRPAGVDEPDPR
jgi:hypothetical protein